ncbi:MAG: transcription termination factor NusA [Patescibacteria group bacterium]|nr:transcription termination factor NusA [Patescibacteria group bacterium]
MNEAFEQALTQICEEKGLDRDEVIKMIEGALAAAFRKDYGKKDQNAVVELNPESLATRVFDVKTVVEDEILEEEFDPQKQLKLSDAKKLKKSIKVSEELRTDITPKEGTSFGRIAAQTAKQVIVQKLREAEREIVFKEYKAKERTLVSGMVQRLEGDTVLVDLGRGSGVLFPSEQIRGENYRIGSRIKVLILHVEPTPKGPKITLSRSHPDMVRRLFEIEVPEVNSGVVEIKSVAREAGSRAKVAVWSNQEGIDPIGSCVGQRGARIDTIRSELGGEKIDVVEWSEDTVKFIAKALSPAKIISVELDEENKEAKVSVMEDQLSLAIGKAGQNVRLAARLTGWKLDIKPEKIGSEEEKPIEESAPAETPAEEKAKVGEVEEQAADEGEAADDAKTEESKPENS